MNILNFSVLFILWKLFQDNVHLIVKVNTPLIGVNSDNEQLLWQHGLCFEKSNIHICDSLYIKNQSWLDEPHERNDCNIALEVFLECAGGKEINQF